LHYSCVFKFCVKFGHLILRKIFKFVATRCQILSLKCTKFNFGLGLRPIPLWGAYGALPYLLTGFKGNTSNARDGKRWGMEEWQGRGETDFLPLCHATNRRHSAFILTILYRIVFRVHLITPVCPLYSCDLNLTYIFSRCI